MLEKNGTMDQLLLCLALEKRGKKLMVKTKEDHDPNKYKKCQILSLSCSRIKLRLGYALIFNIYYCYLVFIL